MFISLINTFAVLAVLVSAAFAADPALGSYNIDSEITVSGLSSGGFMAVQVSNQTLNRRIYSLINCS